MFLIAPFVFLYNSHHHYNINIDFSPALVVDKSGRLNTAFCKKRILDVDVYSGKSIWKFANLKGRVRSASHGDLQIMKDDTMTPDFTLRNTNLYPVKAAYPAGQAPLEKLPLEILSEFCSLQIYR